MIGNSGKLGYDLLTAKSREKRLFQDLKLAD